MAGQHDLLGAYFVGDVETFDIFRNHLGVEFSGGPSRQHAHALGFSYQQPGRNSGAFDFVGNAEVSDAEIGRH